VTPRTLSRSLGIKTFEAYRLTNANDENQVLSRQAIERAMGALGWKPIYSSEVQNA
jgi:hypothetical protein